ncbi:hypothetical protein SAMN05421736_102228 [Evansella caseinilytica]|uniref:YqgU-like 6-bladed beta-propeller domain-containing protein n=1 Tax=Evansella caseinilytica TaxID=1503961 RepID=A0A1H3KSC4_9BACI|nr:hypothetical protein [Evansella caseinilytica]SDY54574.1 hypothetical protein SAMN05421736_102228 [Evansella caseinilytica]
MRYITLLLSLILFFLIGCQGNHPLTAEELAQREAARKEVTKLMPSIYPLQVDRFAFQAIAGWYDDDHLLYITDENGEATIWKHHLYSGTTAAFFSSNDPIIDITPSPDYQWFAIRTIPIQSTTDIYFVNKDGKVMYEWPLDGMSVEVFWDPYTSGQAMLGVLHDDYSTSATFVNVKDQSVKLYHDLPSYLQWISQDMIGYMDWETNSMQFEAPLVVARIDDSEGVLPYEAIQQSAVLLIGLNHGKYLTVKLEDMATLQSRYEIHDAEQAAPAISWTVPGINLYSGQWWIPNFAIGKDSFYYFHPNEAANIDDAIHYRLVAVNIIDGEAKDLLETENAVPIKVSPDESWLLLGNQLEFLWSPRYGRQWELLTDS